MHAKISTRNVTPILTLITCTNHAACCHFSAQVLEKLDEEGCACVGRLLRSLPYDSVFVVGQAGSFVTREFGCVDVVVKAGGAARVELSGSSTPPPIDCS
jgi:hypothetical protein